MRAVFVHHVPQPPLPPTDIQHIQGVGYRHDAYKHHTYHFSKRGRFLPPHHVLVFVTRRGRRDNHIVSKTSVPDFKLGYAQESMGIPATMLLRRSLNPRCLLPRLPQGRSPMYLLCLPMPRMSPSIRRRMPTNGTLSSEHQQASAWADPAIHV